MVTNFRSKSTQAALLLFQAYVHVTVYNTSADIFVQMLCPQSRMALIKVTPHCVVIKKPTKR